MSKNTKGNFMDKFPIIPDGTKSELVFDADITKSLHQEGRWYLIPQKYCYMYIQDTHLNSLVFHVCSKSWEAKSYPNERGVERLHINPHTIHRYNHDGMSTPCGYCQESVPKSIVGLWTLHNWDYLSLNDHDA